jgi:hypothetical protein
MHNSELNQRLAELEAALIKYVERYGLNDQARALLAEPEKALPCSKKQFTLKTGKALGRGVVQAPSAVRSVTATTSAQMIYISK